jgi:hypothetical protein
MLLDKQTTFSEDQALTATAYSTNIVDRGAVAAVGAVGKGDSPAEVWVQVTTTFASGTTLQVILLGDDQVAMSSPTALQTTAAIATAALVAGYQFSLGVVPVGAEQFLRLQYVITGTHDAGKVSAGLVINRQTNNS